MTAALEHQQPSECLEFLDSIAETCGKKARAPHLARFELLKRVGSSNVALRAIMEPVKLMRLYFEQFGNKGCTVGDLRLYLNLLNFEEQSQLLESVS